jgi:hypothetical protein
LHLVDISGAVDTPSAAAIHGLLARRVHRRAPHAHDVDDAHDGPDDLLALLRQAGLTDITAAEQATSRLGPHTFYHATR